jgi:hypothetical protein
MKHEQCRPFFRDRAAEDPSHWLGKTLFHAQKNRKRNSWGGLRLLFAGHVSHQVANELLHLLDVV